MKHGVHIGAAGWAPEVTRVSYLLRVLLPDRPGMLGAVASALGQVGADILSIDVVERAAGVAVDDMIVDLPPGKLADALVTAPDRVAELLVTGAPRIFRAGWAVVVRYDERGPLVEAASPAAPELRDLDLPWLPIGRAEVLDPTARWVPVEWGALGTELAAAPLGHPDRAVLVGRPGGPAWRPAELLRLAHLAGIAVTVAGHSNQPQ